jgi:hypothetical protein
MNVNEWRIMTMSTKTDLHEKTTAAKEKLRAARGATDQVDPVWEAIVEDFIASVYGAADMGDTKYFLDMKNHNQQTILKVSAEVKERLGDVLVIVSPRGIEANWEVSE